MIYPELKEKYKISWSVDENQAGDWNPKERIKLSRRRCIEEATANYRNWRSPRLHENTVELRTLSGSNLWPHTHRPWPVCLWKWRTRAQVFTMMFVQQHSVKRVSAIKMLSVLLRLNFQNAPVNALFSACSKKAWFSESFNLANTYVC